MFEDVGTYVVTLTVRDARGLESRDELTVTVDESAPSVAIETPTDGDRFSHGDPLPLRGSATTSRTAS